MGGAERKSKREKANMFSRTVVATIQKMTPFIQKEQKAKSEEGSVVMMHG